MLGMLIAFLAAASAAFIEKPDPNTLWEETGTNISVGQKIGQWRAGGLEIKTADGGGFVLKGEGGKHHTGHYVPLNRAYRYLVMDITQMERGQGYSELTLLFLNLPGGPVPGMVSNIQTGRFILPVFPAGATPPNSVFLRIYLFNTAITVKSLKMVKQPVDNLEILPAPADVKAVKPGDSVTFRVTLVKPAEDATLTFYDSYLMPRLRINGQSRMQLKPEDETQKVWAATVKLNALTGDGGRGGVDLKPGELMVKTTILGGSIEEPLWTWNTIPFNFKASEK